MEIHIETSAESLDKRDRSWLHVVPLDTASDRLVDVIWRDGGADDGMHLCRQVTRCRHPVVQRYWHRYDPLACRHPGHDTLDQMGRGLGHAPPRA
jgi:hypothetical protein